MKKQKTLSGRTGSGPRKGLIKKINAKIIKKKSAEMLADAAKLLDEGRIFDSLNLARNAMAKLTRLHEKKRDFVLQMAAESLRRLQDDPREQSKFLRDLKKSALGRKYALKAETPEQLQRLVLEMLFGTTTENGRRNVGRYNQALTVLRELNTPTSKIIEAIGAHGGIDGLVDIWREKFGAADAPKKNKATELSIAFGPRKFKLKPEELDAGLQGVKKRGRIHFTYEKSGPRFRLLEGPIIAPL